MGAIGTTRTNQNNDSNFIQTVIILDQSVPEAKVTQRFTKKIIPLALSKLSRKKSQLVHLLTFGKDKTSVEEKLQSILQTLAANKRIRIIILTNEEVEGRQEIENFAATLMKCLSGSNCSADLHVVRLASECRQSWLRINNTTTSYNLIDVDDNKSNQFIATRIVELFHSEYLSMHNELRMNNYSSETQAQSTATVSSEHAWHVNDWKTEDLRNLDYVERAEYRSEMEELQKKRRRRWRLGCCFCGIVDKYFRYCDFVIFIIVALLLILWYLGKITVQIRH